MQILGFLADAVLAGIGQAALNAPFTRSLVPCIVTLDFKFAKSGNRMDIDVASRGGRVGPSYTGGRTEGMVDNARLTDLPQVRWAR